MHSAWKWWPQHSWWTGATAADGGDGLRTGDGGGRPALARSVWDTSETAAADAAAGSGALSPVAAPRQSAIGLSRHSGAAATSFTASTPSAPVVMAVQSGAMQMAHSLAAKVASSSASLSTDIASEATLLPSLAPSAPRHSATNTAKCVRRKSSVSSQLRRYSEIDSPPSSSRSSVNSSSSSSSTSARNAKSPSVRNAKL
mmetsp:Transcript_15304/g.30723  ORF Transcript_15304/g.30723 Transcript_15304/m.30723 type:complete len:200 (+) Transcript_15304:189-788(+)